MKFSRIHLFPRKYNPFLTPLQLPSVKLEGNFIKDGLSKYDLDFIETVEFTQKALEFLRDFNPNTIPSTKNGNLKTGICFQEEQEFTFDYTLPKTRNSIVLIVDLQQLPLSNKELQVLKRICKDFTSGNGILKLKLQDLQGAPSLESSLLDQKRFLALKFLEILEKSREIKMSNYSAKDKTLEFPTEWLRIGN